MTERTLEDLKDAFNRNEPMTEEEQETLHDVRNAEYGMKLIHMEGTEEKFWDWVNSKRDLCRIVWVDIYKSLLRYYDVPPIENLPMDQQAKLRIRAMLTCKWIHTENNLRVFMKIMYAYDNLR